MRGKSLEYRVFMDLLRHQDYGPSEMAAYLNVNYNLVKAIHSRLCKEGFLQRERRGQCSLQMPRSLFDMYSEIEKLRGE